VARRLTFDRLPQVAVVHQRRRPLRWTNSQPQPVPGHALTRKRSGDVSSCPADQAIAAAGAARPLSGAHLLNARQL
jgi:hypothetical protein